MTQNEYPSKILFIDDDNQEIEKLQNALKKHNISLIRANNLDTALYVFNQQIFEVIVVELEFGPLPGLALVQKFRKHQSPERRATGIIISCGKQCDKFDDNLRKELGDLEFLDKPINEFKFLSLIQRAVERRRDLLNYENIRNVTYQTLNTSHDVDKALSYLKENSSQIPQRAPQMMCELYESAERYQDALRVVDTLLAKKPDELALVNTKGRLLLKTGSIDQAMELMKKADELAPKNIERIQNLAKLYLETKQPEKSVEKMREAISLSPENVDLKFDMFKDLDNHGYIDHAIALCKDTTTPIEVVRYYNNKGVVLSKKGDIDLALREYHLALKFYPKFNENYRIYFNIAIAEANKKTLENLKNAMQALEKCLSLEPNFKKATELMEKLKPALPKKTA